MEILFENSYVRDRKMAKEIYTHICFKSRLMLAYAIYAVLYSLFCLITSIYFGNYTFFIFVLISNAILYSIQVYVCRTKINADLKNDLELFGKEPFIVVTVTNEGIYHAIQGFEEYSLIFSRTKKAVRTKNYIFLQTDSRRIYAFKKDGFTIGNEEGLVAFLESKDISVKKRF